MLHDLAPKSLGDTSNSKPEASLYGQIIKWFQNHSYMQGHACITAKPAKKKKGTTVRIPDEGDDEEAVKSHLSALNIELKKKKWDEDKVVRLLSFTYACRRSKMMSDPASTRITATLREYPCFMKAIYLSQEMYLSIGERFSTYDDVRLKVRILGHRWCNSLCPAILQLAEETEPACIEQDANGISMYCLEFLVGKLKKRGKLTVDPLDSIICFAPSLDECLVKTDNTNPCVGTPRLFTTSVVVCNGKVITGEIGQLVISSVVVLLAIHYVYALSYNPVVQPVMEFLQEMLLSDSLPPSRKTTSTYSNLFRAINCLEQKLQSELPPPTFPEEQTQLCDF